MTLSRKDAAATVLTGLAVLAFLASYKGWGVPLVGDSHRWAAGAIMLCGWMTCALGEQKEAGSPHRWSISIWLLMALGVAALVFFVLAVVTGSIVLLTLLIIDTVLLWAGSTLRHLLRSPGQKSLAA